MFSFDRVQLIKRLEGRLKEGSNPPTRPPTIRALVVLLHYIGADGLYLRQK